jgi:DNA repair protein RadC
MEGQRLLRVSEVKLTYQPKVKASERYYIAHSEDTYKLLKEHCYDESTLLTDEGTLNR